jgi:hypothetical protein
MTFNVKINPNPETKIVAKVTKTAGILQTSTPVTVKNQLREYQINSIQDLPDVAETNVSNGSTLVFNSTTNLYEVKPLDAGNITGVIDGGEF